MLHESTVFAGGVAGPSALLTLPNGVLVEYGYDAASRVTSITYKQNGTTVLGDLTYEYDKAGNRTKIGGSFARTGIPQAIASTAYNAANHQTTFGDKTLTYDNNGNVQTVTDSSGTTTYTWNARNQLTGISGPAVNASFVYDGLGRREKKTINSNLTEFLFDGLNPVQETSGANILANILPGLGIDEFLTRTDVGTSATSAFLSDALGSSIALTDAAGAVQTEYNYEPFGKISATGGSNSSSYQYTGRENDGTDLYYYRARYYHPVFQRFISEDPIEFRGSDINLYTYVHNSPLIYIDPDGQWSWLGAARLLFRVTTGVLQIGPAAIALDLLGGPQCLGGCPLNDVDEVQKIRDFYENNSLPPPPPNEPPVQPPPSCGRKDCSPPKPPLPPPSGPDWPFGPSL
jgi:RHS repeat-associated protein